MGGCANKALPTVGMDPDDFRTGHTKIMFRAGRLSKLEEIRESALSVIVLKMQAHVRKCLVAVTYKVKAAEKKGIASIQNNVRNYYRCKNWAWYQFYMLVVSEGAKIRKKREEEERRKLMAEGFDKLQKALNEKVAAREAVQAVNVDLKAKLAATKEAVDKERVVSGSIADEIKAIEKPNATKDLAAMKDKAQQATGGYNGLKNRAIAAEADKVALKGEIACIGEEVARLDKAATRLLREKHEMWQSISFNKQCRWMHERFLASVSSE